MQLLTWLVDYAKMVSTAKYQEVCLDLIAEAIDIFDGPRFIHFGIDEEDIGCQKHFDYIVIRHQERWLADLYFYIDEAFKKGVRLWV